MKQLRAEWRQQKGEDDYFEFRGEDWKVFGEVEVRHDGRVVWSASWDVDGPLPLSADGELRLHPRYDAIGIAKRLVEAFFGSAPEIARVVCLEEALKEAIAVAAHGDVPLLHPMVAALNGTH